MKQLLSIWLWLLASVCYGEKITGAGDPWPPFLSPDLPGQGVALEIVTEAFKREGYELDMNFVPWARAIDGVKKASYDVLVGTWWTEERTKFLHYSDSYLENRIKFIKRKGDDFEFNGLASLDGKKVGIIRGYGYGDEFLNAANFTRPETSDLIKNLKKLVAKRIDITLEDEIVAKALIADKEPKLIEQIEFTNNALSINKLHVSSGLKNKKHKAIIDAFNKGLKAIKEDGTFDKILQKHKLK
ncbi:substrate-binding periplasmic protein [Spartinivicinus poritis]|uniref:Transporter substrate-binding domain-containing protein n=1 Tax=Spartinivicinus poritis TaxID=2994640 RepID=A0ABT5UHU5_9GAMM|nr:transporter substrate-binding domain-containing protein [Spartinivicinus sp. A2-2]MDE1465013.1 transporter substrate-binding domain-containing protein [Spartinivicinus sp. A2-2]